jgi:ribosomal protein S6--L-glutamate ligase
VSYELNIMIVSFHPLFEADNNIICAGREPDADDLAAIKAARAVILPQGCRQSLYEMARDNCRHVFPDYEIRFRYPGKIGQMRLFQESGTAHPHAETYRSLNDFRQQYGDDLKDIAFELPWVFKFDWGGEGETVFLINTPQDLKKVLQKAADFERSGQRGFLLQEYVPTEGRTLRVAVIGRTLISYWRIQENPDDFLSSVSRGARIDAVLAPERQGVAKGFVKDLCKKTGINLAGFDVIFAPAGEYIKPLMLEINYFFGRRGLGGSDAFYEILKKEINGWLANALSRQDK